MKEIVLSFVLLSTTLTAFPSDNEVAERRTLGVFSQMDLYSESVWHGWDLSANKPAFISYVAADIFQTGFEFTFWTSLPLDRSLRVNDIVELGLRYHETKLEGNLLQFNLHGFINYIALVNETDHPYKPYPVYPDDLNNPSLWFVPEGDNKLWKLNLGLSFDKLIPIAGSYLVPAVDLYHIEPHGDTYFTKGNVWEFTLNYNHGLAKKWNYNLKFNAIYHERVFDNYAWGAFVFSHGWKYSINDHFALRAGINYQISPDPAINSDNEFWGNIGVDLSF